MPNFFDNADGNGFYGSSSGVYGPNPIWTVKDESGDTIAVLSSYQGASASPQSLRMQMPNNLGENDKGEFNLVVQNGLFNSKRNPTLWLTYNCLPDGSKIIAGEHASFLGFEGYYNDGAFNLAEQYFGYMPTGSTTQMRWLMTTFNRADNSTTTFIAGDAISIKGRNDANKTTDFNETWLQFFRNNYTFQGYGAADTVLTINPPTGQGAQFVLGHGDTAAAATLKTNAATQMEVVIGATSVARFYDFFGQPAMAVGGIDSNDAALVAQTKAVDAPAIILRARNSQTANIFEGRASNGTTVNFALNRAGLPTTRVAGLSANTNVRSTAAAIVAPFSNVSSANTSNTAIGLPTPNAAGETYEGFNSSVRTVLLFPAGASDTVNGGSGGASINIPTLKPFRAIALSTTEWAVIVGS